MGVKINSTGGGSVTLDAPSTASNLTVTLPSASGTLTTTSGSTFADITVTGNSYFATSSGNVGIGTSSPATKTEISSSQSALTVTSTTTAQASYLLLRNTADSSNAYVYTTGKELRLAQADTSASSIVTFSTQNAERMRIDSSGNVGIGTSSPLVKLAVGGSYGGGYNGTLAHFFGSNVAQFNGTGMVTVGTTNATGADLGGSIGLASYDSNISSPYPCAVISGRRETGTAGNYSGYFAVATVANNGSINERMRIDSSGGVRIGTTSPLVYSAGTEGLSVYNSGGAASVLKCGGNTYPVATFDHVYGSGTQTYCYFTYSGATTGNIQSNGSGTSYNTSSDYRLKENIQPMQNALGVVAQLNPVTYTWKADGSDGQGFIAHELQAVVPDCVTGEKDAVDAEGKPVYQGIDTSFLVATLTKAIQELKAELDELKAKVN